MSVKAIFLIEDKSPLTLEQYLIYCLPRIVQAMFRKFQFTAQSYPNVFFSILTGSPGSKIKFWCLTLNVCIVTMLPVWKGNQTNKNKREKIILILQRTRATTRKKLMGGCLGFFFMFSSNKKALVLILHKRTRNTGYKVLNLYVGCQILYSPRVLQVWKAQSFHSCGPQGASPWCPSDTLYRT